MYKQCKTERSAARQRLFEQGLLELMSVKHYDEISVMDLCTHLQIPRKSFYRYFSSKDGALHALLDHTMMDYESFNAVYTEGVSRTLQRELTQFFLFWQSRKDLLDALFRCNMGGTLVQRVIDHVSEDTIIPRRFLVDELPYVRQQVTLFCVSGLMSMVLSWHQEGYPHPAEEMAAITARLVSQPLFPQLKDQL